MAKTKCLEFTEHITDEFVLKASIKRLLERHEEIVDVIKLCGEDLKLTIVEVPLVPRYRISAESVKKRFNILVDELAEVQELLRQLQDS